MAVGRSGKVRCGAESPWRPRQAHHLQGLSPILNPNMASRNVQGRIANAKSIGWAIYVAGFAIWLFGYLSAGHAPVFDWKGATPWWISSFVPNLEAELGLALMFASMIPIYWREGRKRG